MEENIMENFETISSSGLVFTNGEMGGNMKGPTNMTRNMDLVNTHGSTEENTSDIGPTENSMDMGNIT
jgi:hypothetical protein